MVLDPHNLSGKGLKYFVLLIRGELSSTDFHVLGVVLANRLDDLLGVLLFEVFLVPLALELVELVAIVPESEPQLEFLLEFLHNRNLRGFVAQDCFIGVEIVDLALRAFEALLDLLELLQRGSLLSALVKQLFLLEVLNLLFDLTGLLSHLLG